MLDRVYADLGLNFAQLRSYTGFYLRVTRSVIDVIIECSKCFQILYNFSVTERNFQTNFLHCVQKIFPKFLQ